MERGRMPRKASLTANERNLIRRYLIWCYKTTKEDLDRIDRYFTQIKADEVVLKQLRKARAHADRVGQFQAYMKSKEDNALKKKFKDGKGGEMLPEYQYLRQRFTAIETAICYFLGVKELKKICSLYETEMTRRILEAREHT